MVTLYNYWRSSACYRVRIVLELARIEWIGVNIDLAKGEQKGADYLRQNPQGLVPKLVIDGLELTQSLAIIEYVNEQYNLGLLPDTAAGRAEVRAIAYAVAMDIHPVCNIGTAHYAVEESLGAIKLETWMRKFISAGLSSLENMVDRHGYCYGRNLSAADICLAPQMYNAERWCVEIENFPKISAIYKNLKSLSAFQNASPNSFL